MTTTKTQYALLLAAKQEADKQFFSYRKLFNKEHKIEHGIITDTIIRLHKKGLSIKEILKQRPDLNKGTVRRQIRLYKKGKRVEKTTVAKYILKKNHTTLP